MKETKHARTLDANEILELIFIYLTEVSGLRKHDEIINVLANMGRALTSSDRCTVWVVSDDKKKYLDKGRAWNGRDYDSYRFRNRWFCNPW
ncbi:MAG: hypothetical protein Q9M40_14490 [Sulfurimonas sp.]|nr:hypothetical protein [Sulfurimonas sp.]